MVEEIKEKKKYWILYYSEECVLCGRGEEYKIRIYDRPKPEKIEDRYEYHQFVCDDHFL